MCKCNFISFNYFNYSDFSFINLLSITTGACDTLRLTGGKNYPKGITLVKFMRQGPEAGLSTRYKSINDNETEIFFVSELNSWAIGNAVSSRLNYFE